MGFLIPVILLVYVILAFWRPGSATSDPGHFGTYDGALLLFLFSPPSFCGCKLRLQFTWEWGCVSRRDT